MIAGGLIAHQGLVSLPGAMVAAAAGSFAADQAFFALGRGGRHYRWVQRIMATRAYAKALEWLERYPVGFIFAFRFLYGLRTVSPIAIGTSTVSTRLYLVVNALSAATWAVLFVSLGYLFGEAVTEMMGRLRPTRQTLLWGAAALLAVAMTFQMVRWWRRWRS